MMLSDHQNLLSTFGKDSQSSNRKSRDVENAVKSKRISLNYDRQPKSRYQQILSQRKTLMMIDKMQQPTIKHKNVSKKLKTQSDIDYLNNRIRKSISNIAQTIGKSKSKSNLSIKQVQLEQSVSSRKKLSNISKDVIHSHKYLKAQDSKKFRPSAVIEKQNINLNNFLNNFEQSKRSNPSKQQYLKNSTKKKGKFFQQENQCPIKSSFSIDLNSESESLFQQSRKKLMQRKCSKFNILSNNQIHQSSQVKEKINKQMFNKKYSPAQISIGKEMEQTLKKEFRQLAESNYVQQPKFLQTKGNKNNKFNQQFLFYEDLQTKDEQKSPNFNFNNIHFPQSYDISSAKKNFNKEDTLKSAKMHKLIFAFMKQIELDYDLRHAKHMFSGIQQPYYAFPNNQQSQSKWQKLNYELNNLGLFYSVQTIKKIFLPSEQEIDPFLSVGKPHDQLIYSLIYAYQTAEIHWEQNIFQKWQHWDLRDIQLTIENIDRDRKGFITVEDIAAFVSMQTGKQYKNRDVVLIYKRLVNGFCSRRQDSKQSFKVNQIDKNKLKFRALIDCLIKPF